MTERWGEEVTKLSKDFHRKASKAIEEAVRQPPRLRGNQGKRIER